MNRNIKHLLTLSILFFTLWVLNAHSNFWDSENIDSEPTTIREMQENIETLEKEKDKLEFKWNSFQIGSDSLWDLIQENITASENLLVEEIVFSYSNKKINLEKELEIIIGSKQDTENIQKELLLLKKEFYKSLIPYIEINKLDSFKRYIDLDLTYNEKSKLVSTQIEEKQLKRIERVEEIQDKIEDNNKILRENIEKRITTEVHEKLNNFISEDAFKNLTNDEKRQVFAKVIGKIELKIINMNNITNATSIIEEKIILFEIVLDILKSYTEKWN